VLNVGCPGYQREIQLWFAHTCPSVILQHVLHTAGQADERTGQVERPTWETRDRHHVGRIHRPPCSGGLHQDQEKSDIVPTSQSNYGMPQRACDVLDKIVDNIMDKDGKIPSVKEVSDIQEELRLTYFNSLTSDNPPEPVSSEDEATKAGCLDMLVIARTNKLHKFHPMEMYIYFHFGPPNVKQPHLVTYPYHSGIPLVRCPHNVDPDL
jgi:hypothetical protein